MPDNTEAVSKETEEGTSSASEGQDGNTSAEQGQEGEEKKGFDSLPDWGKDLVRRQTSKRQEAEGKVEEYESKMSELEAKIDKIVEKDNDPTREISDDEKEQLEMFNKLAKAGGYVPQDTVQQLVQQEVGKLQEQQRRDRDQKELENILERFDGKELPKLELKEMRDFFSRAENDPALQHWLDPNVPFEEIARYIKQDEIRQMEVDKLMKEGGTTPPNVPSTNASGKQPPKSVKRANSISELEAMLDEGMQG